MHSDNNPFYPRKTMNDPVGCYMQNVPPMASIFNGLVPSGIKPPTPFHNVDIHPSVVCPRNFIIFDQTINRSQIIAHPEISFKMLNNPGLGHEPYLFQGNFNGNNTDDEGKISTTLKEDSADIDALLSTEYEEDQESDDEVSTARTNAIYNCSSPDSCSNYEPISKKSRLLCRKSSSSLSRGNEKKREKMRKMVKALRGIVPGAHRMSTVAVLDEAVRYLKSLRVEAQKLGVGQLIK